MKTPSHSLGQAAPSSPPSTADSVDGVHGDLRHRLRPLLALGAVGLPVALAIGLTLYGLSAPSLWIDEGATFAIASQHGAALWAGMRHDGGNMLAYYALLHVLLGWFGHSPFVLRIPSVFATAGTVALVWALTRRLFGSSVGFASALLTAVSLPLVYWGRDARGYAAMVTFVALSYLGFIALVDGESAKRPGRPPRWAWPAYVGGIVLAAYMSIAAVLVVPAQLLSLLWRPRRLRPVATGVFLSALLCVPLALLAVGRGSSQLFWVRRPNLTTTGQAAEAVLSVGLTPTYTLTATSLPLLALTVVALILTVVAGLRRLGKGSLIPWRGEGGALVAGASHERAVFAGATVASWLVVPLLLILVESLVGQSIYVPRYMLISLPPVAILLAWGALRTRVATWLGWGGLGALVVLRALQITPTYGVSPENWKQATAYVLDADRPGACIAFYPSDGRTLFAYYAKGRDSVAPRPVLPSLPFSKVKPFVEDYATLSPPAVRRLSRSCRVVWLVSTHVGSNISTPLSRAHRRAFDRLVTDLSSAFGSKTSVRFGYAQAIRVELFRRF